MADSLLVSNVPIKPDVLTSGSRSILGYSYDASNYTLDLWFRGPRNSVYRYFMVVPPVKAQILDTGPSIGLKARKVLQGYRVQKLR